MTSIFFSYCHVDEELRDKLETHLSALKRSRLIDTWHDRRIVAGTEFEGKISEHLEKADIILILVSSDFIASEYCYSIEMTRAMERHREKSATVIPVILRPCDWHDTPFGKLLALPKDGKPIVTWTSLDEAFVDVVKGIKGALPNKKAEEHASPIVDGAPKRQAPIASILSPRSSNLGMRREFTQAEKDRFLLQSFEFIEKYFENSLFELEHRNSNVESSFRRIDANRFSAAIYKNGEKLSQCSIFLGGHGHRGIAYSTNADSSTNSYNEHVSVGNDNHSLFLKPMGMGFRSHFGTGDAEGGLTQEGAAEYFWGILMEPLQR